MAQGLRSLGLVSLLVVGLSGCGTDAADTNPDPSAGSGDGGATGSAGHDGGALASEGAFADWLNKCPLNGQTVEHPAVGGPIHISADETWAGDGTVHWIHDTQVYIDAAATLTIEPCAIIQVDHQNYIDAVDKGHLVAQGTADKPIIFLPRDSAKRWWGLMASARPPEAGDAALDLAYVLIAQAGDPDPNFNQPAIRTVGDLRLQHVAVLDGTGVGIEMDNGGFTADSKDVTISGTSTPIAIAINNERALGSVPAGTYTGNTRDVIDVAHMTVTHDITLHDLGVPFAFGPLGLEVRTMQEDVPVTLSIDPGVELQFDTGAQLTVGYGPAPKAVGKIEALGTKAKPIRLTGLKQEPGAWGGIWLANPSSSQLENVLIEYAGGDFLDGVAGCLPEAGPQGAALIVGYPSATYVPVTDIFKNSSISHSAGLGILSLWVDAGGGPDLTAGNEFEDIADCKQSTPLAEKFVNKCWTYSCLVP